MNRLSSHRQQEKCKHKVWQPFVTEGAEGWFIAPQCKTCGIFGSPDEAKLSNLIMQMVSIRARVEPTNDV